MKYDMDELMKEIYTEEIRPNDILNQKTFHKMKESGNMSNFTRFRKTAVAAAAICVISIGGVSAYAATQHYSLLSLFQDENDEVKNTASELLEKDIEQGVIENKEQTQYAKFSVREAICDKNKVNIQLVASPAEKSNYLLVPSEYWNEIDTLAIDNLQIEGNTDKNISIAEYAKKNGYKCLKIDMWVDSNAVLQSIGYATEADRTIVCTISFENREKTNDLKYSCITMVYPSDDGSDDSIIRDSFDFVISDKTEDVETITYSVDSVEVPGTNLVIDSVEFEKSALEMICNIKYHSKSIDVSKNFDKWLSTEESDVCFYLLDENGNIIDSLDGYGSDLCGDGKILERDRYSIMDLPETISFLVQNCMTKEKLGIVTFKVNMRK